MAEVWVSVHSVINDHWGQMDNSTDPEREPGTLRTPTVLVRVLGPLVDFWGQHFTWHLLTLTITHIALMLYCTEYNKQPIHIDEDHIEYHNGSISGK